MAAPEGYTELGRIGFVDKGNYASGTTYRTGDVVYYNGSTWVALKDNLRGVTPAPGANWKYMARGFAAEALSAITAVDTSGVLREAGASVTSQELIDAIADKVMTKLIEKSKIVNNLLATDATTVLSGPMGKSLDDKITQLNSDLASITGLIVKDITLNPGYAIYGTWATRIIKDKSSGICVINLAIKKADNSVINTNTYVDIGILPDGFLPIHPTGASGIGEEPGAINHPVGIILFEGKIKATTYGENTRNIIASFSYSTN